MTDHEQFEAWWIEYRGFNDRHSGDAWEAWQAARAAPAQPTRSQKLAEAGFTRRPTTLEIQLSGEDEAPAQPEGEKVLLSRKHDRRSWEEVESVLNDNYQYAWATLERVK